MSEKMYTKRSFLLLTFSLIIQNVITTIFNTTDALMLGVLQPEMLSAVTLANQVPQIYSVLLIALGVGCTALSTQYYGDDDIESVKKVMYITFQMSGAISLVFFAACFFFPRLIMSIYTNQQNLIALGIPYLKIVSISFLIMGFSQICMNVMKNIGRERQIAAIGVVVIIVNLVLDALMIFGLYGCPRLEINGAAIATVIARGVEAILVVILIIRFRDFRFSIKGLFLRYRGIRRKYLRYTLPSLFQSGSWMIASSLTVGLIGHLGPEITAANAMVLVPFNIFAGITNGFSAAVSVVIGKMLGANEVERAKKTADSMLKASNIAAILFGGLFMALTPAIMHIDDGMSELTRSYLIFMMIYIGFKCMGKFVNTFFSLGVLSAGGDIRFMMKMDMINMWCVILPLGYFAAYVLHLHPLAVFAILNMDHFTKIYFEYKRYKKYIWAKNLTYKEWAEPGHYEDLIRRRIFEEMPLGVIVIGGNGRIMMCNNAAAGVFGMTTDEMTGISVRSLVEKGEGYLELIDIMIDAVKNKDIKHYQTVETIADNEKRKLQVCSEFIEDEEYKQGVYLTISQI